MRSLTLPQSGLVVQLKGWITGRDDEFISQPMTDIKLTISEAGKTSGEVSAGAARTESIHRAIATVVISINGSTEGILDQVRDLPKADYKLVLDAVDKIVTGENFEQPASTTDGGTD